MVIMIDQGEAEVIYRGTGSPDGKALTPAGLLAPLLDPRPPASVPMEPAAPDALPAGLLVALLDPRPLASVPREPAAPDALPAASRERRVPGLEVEGVPPTADPASPPS